VAADIDAVRSIPLRIRLVGQRDASENRRRHWINERFGDLIPREGLIVSRISDRGKRLACDGVHAAEIAVAQRGVGEVGLELGELSPVTRRAVRGRGLLAQGECPFEGGCRSGHGVEGGHARLRGPGTAFAVLGLACVAACP